MSWFTELTDGTKDWNASIRDSWKRAASDLQKFADQAELQQLGEKVRASAQSIAENSEAALHSFAESSEAALREATSATGLGLFDGLNNLEDVPLAKRFAAEAAKLEDAEPNTVARLAADIFQSWIAVSESTAGIRALLESEALPRTLRVLGRSQADARGLLHMAIHRIESKSSSRDGEALGLLLKKFSSVQPEILLQTLKIFTDAADAVSETKSPEAQKDLDLALILLEAALLGPETLGSGATKALQTADALAEATTARAARAEILEPGSKVWAERPTDGRWYRAEVMSCGEQVVEVTWLQPPADIACGAEAEYLSAATGDQTTSSALHPGAVVVLKDRPAPAMALAEEDWLKAIGNADALANNFRELRDLCAKPGDTKDEPVEARSRAALKSLVTIRSQVEAQQTSTSMTEEELQELQEKQDQDSACKAELLKRRRELELELSAIDGELAQLGKVSASGVHRQLLSRCESAVSDLEASLVARQERMSKLCADPARLTAACTASERRRRRQLEELMAGFHAAIWGPESSSLRKHAALVSALRSAHSRAERIVEQAWREAVQLAAEVLGDDDMDSEDMSRAGKRYKEMRNELEQNLERLAKLAPFDPPSRVQ